MKQICKDSKVAENLFVLVLNEGGAAVCSVASLV